MFCPNEKSLRTAIQLLLKQRWPASFYLQMGQHHLVVKKDIAPVSGFPHWTKFKKMSLSCVWLHVTPWTVSCQAPLSMEFSRQDTGVGCHSLLQGIFQTQGVSPGLSHCRQILYHLSHHRSPRRKPEKFYFYCGCCCCSCTLSGCKENNDF